MTVHEVAKRLRISLACAYALIESREMAHYRIGVGRGTIRVSEEQIQAFLGKNEKKRPEKVPAASPVKLKHLSLG